MVWTDSVYANNESPPINKKGKKKKNKKLLISYIYKKSS